MPAPAPLTLSELVTHDGLGLSPVVAGALDRPVLGAHTIEIEGAARWLRPGWLMLTTGLRFGGRPVEAAAARQFVVELVDAGVVGLLFGVDVIYPAVPPAIVEAARDQNFPVYQVAADVPFLLIEEFVNRSVLSTDLHLLRRQLSVQNTLLVALSQPHPVKALVARLAELVRGSATVYEESGRVVGTAGPGPVRLIWSEVQARRLSRQSFMVGRWRVASRPVTVAGVGYVLALASRNEGVIEGIGDAVLDTAQRVLGAIAGVNALATTQHRAEAAQLLSSLTSGLTADQVPWMWNRLQAFRFRPQQQVRFLCAVPIREGRANDLDILSDLHDEAQASGLPLLVRLTDSAEVPQIVVHGLVADLESLDDLTDQLLRTHDVGLSQPFDDLAWTPRYRLEATRAAGVARRRVGYRNPGEAGAVSQLVKFEDVDLVTWLISSRSAEEIGEKVAQQLGTLIDQTALLETVLAYLACRLDVGRTARRLFLHPNSVRYRLARIEELLQAPLDSPAVIANLYLAFHDQLGTEAADPDAPDA